MGTRINARASLVALSLVVGASAFGCESLPRDPAEPEAHVVYDPANGKIPLPNDLVRDEGANRLALPIAEGLAPAEIELREFMNTLDAWPTTSSLSAEVSAPVDPKTISADTVLVYEWGTTPKRLTDVSARLDAGDTKIVVDAPALGWTRGAHYVVAVRGGGAGVRDVAGRGLVPDRAFYFLRAREKLDTYENNRAFPGATRDERLAVGAKLEKLRLGLVPFFDGLERQAAAVPREDIVALWAFSVTKSTELAMDKASRRMPLPFDVLVDPKTNLVSLPAAPDDDTRELDVKAQLGRDNGFGMGPKVDFELTTAVDPRTATAENVHVYEIGAARELRAARVEVLPTEGAEACAAAIVPDNCRRVMVTLAEEELPLRPATRYAIVVKSGLRARDGGPVRPMVMGHFVRARHPLVDGGKSQVAALSLENAERLEGVRLEVAPLLDRIGRDDLVAAWPFTTLDAEPELRAAARIPDEAALDPTPTITKNAEVKPGLIGLPSGSEIGVFEGMFPGVVDDIVGTIFVPRVRGVRRVIEGTLASPSTLDPATRRRRKDGAWSKDEIRFVMTLPERPASGGKVPVVMFGHGLTTDRRFVLMIAGKLAQAGFAAIGFDFPFHGTRARCTAHGLVGIENPLPEGIRKLSPALKDDLLSLPVCPSGATCTPEGQCVTKEGTVTELAKIPLTDLPAAGGAALLDVDDIPHISDRLRQALVDMNTVRRSLRLADWSKITGGVELETHRVFYTGQSLGGILGTVFVSTSDDIGSAVLNVPGADLVGLFLESESFRPQMKAFLEREKLVEGSYEKARMMNIASWLIDSVDPQSLALPVGKRRVQLQMAGKDTVISNRSTERLQRASKLPMRTYPSSGHGDLVIPGIGDAMLDDLVEFLAAGLK